MSILHFHLSSFLAFDDYLFPQAIQLEETSSHREYLALKDLN